MAYFVNVELKRTDFDSEEDYSRALVEQTRIEKINKRTDITNPIVAATLLEGFTEHPEMFRTIVGTEFLEVLRENSSKVDKVHKPSKVEETVASEVAATEEPAEPEAAEENAVKETVAEEPAEEDAVDAAVAEEPAEPKVVEEEAVEETVASEVASTENPAESEAAEENAVEAPVEAPVEDTVAEEPTEPKVVEEEAVEETVASEVASTEDSAEPETTKEESYTDRVDSDVDTEKKEAEAVAAAIAETNAEPEPKSKKKHKKVKKPINSDKKAMVKENASKEEPNKNNGKPVDTRNVTLRNLRYWILLNVLVTLCFPIAGAVLAAIMFVFGLVCVWITYFSRRLEYRTVIASCICIICFPLGFFLTVIGCMKKIKYVVQNYKLLLYSFLFYLMPLLLFFNLSAWNHSYGISTIPMILELFAGAGLLKTLAVICDLIFILGILIMLISRYIVAIEKLMSRYVNEKHIENNGGIFFIEFPAIILCMFAVIFDIKIMEEDYIG